MTIKESLENRILGWLPKNANVPKVKSTPFSEHKRTFLPVFGGTLTIIGAFAVFFMGTFQIIPSLVGLYVYITEGSFNDPYLFTTSAVGILSIPSFIVGVKAGLSAKDRKRFEFSVAGSILILIAMLATVLLVWITTPMSVISYLRYGLPVAALSIIGLISVLLSRKEFSLKLDFSTDVQE